MDLHFGSELVGFNVQLEDPVDTEIAFINGTQNSQAYKEPFNSQNGSAVTVKWNFDFPMDFVEKKRLLSIPETHSYS